MYAKHNPIQDLVNATQRNLQYTAEANALSNDVQYIVSIVFTARAMLALQALY